MNFDWFDADDIVQKPETVLADHDGGEVAIDSASDRERIGRCRLCQCLPDSSGSVFTTSTFIQSGAASGVVATGTLSYQLLKNTSVTLSAAHLIIPTSFGQLAENDNGRVYDQSRYQSLVQYRFIGERRAHEIRA